MTNKRFAPYQHGIEHTDADTNGIYNVQVNVCHLRQGQGRYEKSDRQNEKHARYVKPGYKVLD